MSSRIPLTVMVLTIAIVLSAAVQQPWQAVLSAAQTDVDPFGSAAPADFPAADPFGSADPAAPPAAPPVVSPPVPPAGSTPVPPAGSTPVDPFSEDPKASKPQRPPAESVDPFVSLFRWSIQLLFKQRPPAESVDRFAAKLADPFGAAAPVVDPFSEDPKASKPQRPPAESVDPFDAKPAQPPELPKTTKRIATAKDRSGEDVIEGELRQMTDLDGIINMQLGDVVDMLAAQHQIVVVIDEKALDEVGIDPNVEITADLKNISLGSALDLILRKIDLTWTISSDVLLITTPEQAAAMLTTKVHDVADLVTFRDEDGELWEDYDSLKETITSNIEQNAWSDVGGSGDVVGGTFGTAKVITVSQTYRIHLQITELLGQLREIAAKRPGDGQPPMKRRPPPVAGFGPCISTIPVVGGQADDDPFGSAAPMQGGMMPRLGREQADDDPFGSSDAPADKPDAVDPFAAKPTQPAKRAEPAETKTTKQVPTAKYGSTSLANRGAAEKRINDALKSPTELDGIMAMPLQDVVDFLKEYHDIEIQIDKMALDEVGSDPNVEITVDLKNVSLGSALDLVLRKVELTWTIHADVLLITTPEQAETMLTTEVHDVADLVTFRDEDGEIWEDYDGLKETITKNIEPNAWSDVGGNGNMVGSTFGTAKVITVSQTYRIHRQIVELLGQLREIAAKSPGDGQPPIKRRPPPQKVMCGMGMGGMGGGPNNQGQMGGTGMF